MTRPLKLPPSAISPLIADVAVDESTPSSSEAGADFLERALQEERAFRETVDDRLADVFFVLDTEFRFVRWNDTVNGVTGRADESLRGTDPLQFIDSEQFAYVASHDLKKPLRMVSSYLQLLECRYGGKLDEDGQEFIEFAVDGARRMQQMIDDLLEYSRIGRQDGGFEPVDCERVLDSVQQNLQVAVAESDATVKVGDLPAVVGDRSRLVELFQNLVSNAIKYAGDEPLVVGVTATCDDGHLGRRCRGRGNRHSGQPNRPSVRPVLSNRRS